MSKPWYQTTPEEAAARFGSDLQQGLSDVHVFEQRQRCGRNEIPTAEGRPRWRILADQFAGVLVQVLIAAALFSWAIGEPMQAAVILAIVVLNAALGYIQEMRAENALEALRRMTVSRCPVRRGGTTREVAAEELVPGDIVLLQAGSRVPADGRLVESANLKVQESALTGEAQPVDKEVSVLHGPETALGDRTNMVYFGTQVVYGHGSFIVTATGMNTECGHTAGLLTSVAPEPSPLQKQLDDFARSLTVIVAGVCTVVFLLGQVQGESVRQMILTAISLAVAAVPESLTAVVTITLALGAQAMLRRGALIRRLSAVETLGAVHVICADKTGTLTQNRMTVSALDVANHRWELRFDRSDLATTSTAEASPSRPSAIDLLLIGGTLCNDAILESTGSAAEPLAVLGEPTEAALVSAGARSGWDKNRLEQTLPRCAELPFDSERKRMATAHPLPHGSDDIPAPLRPFSAWGDPGRRPDSLVFVKGALESILDCSTGVWVNDTRQALDEAWRERMNAAHDRLASEGMRVLALAARTVSGLAPSQMSATLESELTFIGLIGIYDPPRPEVRDAIADCSRAGIQVVMITGDHPLTARRIAHEIGIPAGGKLVTGPELDRLASEDLGEVIRETSIFARVSPAHKLRLVEAYQKSGRAVAMTGDGVNDAPALKKADIGIAMGVIGTDVARQSAEVVLLDDNFATLTVAVREGRTIFDNLVKFILYLLSCNASEIAVVAFAPFLGMPLPLLPLQILWMNLVTDGLPALALGTEPSEPGIMQREPSRAAAAIFGPTELRVMLAISLLMAGLSLGVGYLYWWAGHPAWQTLLLTLLVFGQMAVALALRSRTEPVWRIGWLTNPALLGAVGLTVALHLTVVYMPALQSIFHTLPLSIGDMALVLLSSAAIFFGSERIKLSTFPASTTSRLGGDPRAE